MWYKIDFTKLVVQLLPPILRSGFMINLLRIMIIPLRYVYGKFDSLHTNVSVKLNTTCNVMYLEKALNDAFFLKGSQIFISTPEEVKDGNFSIFGMKYSFQSHCICYQNSVPVT